MARSRKRKTPSFEVPADVTSASQSGWVFRSEVEEGKKRTRKAPVPAAPRRSKAKPSERPVLAAPRPSVAEPSERPVPAAPAGNPRAGGPLRFVWLPFAIACAMALALLPSTGPRSERS